MADAAARSMQYEYKANSNLVLQADLSLIERRGRDEATGEVLSLQGHLTGMKMGDKYLRSKPPALEQDDKEKEKKAKRQKTSDKESDINYGKMKNSTLLSEQMDEMAGIIYRPKTTETRQTYEILLSFIQAAIGDQPHDILCGAADEVLICLKDEKLKEKDRKREIFALLGTMADERFALLSNLGRKITDYSVDKEGGGNDEDMIDENYGVAVQFDEEDEEEKDVREVKDESDEDDDNEGVEADFDGTLHGGLNDDDDGFKKSSEALHPRQIDAYWLQRELNKFYEDPEMSRSKSEEVLEVLKTASDERDLENKLVLLLGHDKFSIIKTVRKHRNMVLYCTLLAMAETVRERKELENIMKGDEELSEILSQLSEYDHEDLVQAERARKAAARKSRVDADLNAIEGEDTMSRFNP